MKFSRRTEIALAYSLLLALNFYLGFVAPWWALAVPAMMAGWFMREGAVRVTSLAALTTWLLKAMFHDLPTGFRLSNRIAGVMGVNANLFTSVVAYLVTGALVTLIVVLSTLSGASLRRAIFKGSSRASERLANRPGD